ncbi:MAG: selenide, water dikinase SelD [Flavisolibacter sp.]
MTEEVRLTQFSKGGGCGCKIAPSVLQQILRSDNKSVYKNLLVGNESSDDAAVFQINDDTAIISTTDFFMPIVDDAYDFGRIASANAISDVYAMGGSPLMAIAVLGWPVGKIPSEIAQRVLEGSRMICKEAGIPLAGGHTIDSLEPIFGLAVTGSVSISNLKKNNTAKQGDLLYLTKRIGVGILSTAVKRNVLNQEHYELLLKQMTTLNSIGEKLGKEKGVHAMTDVTGFGFLGHSIEMAEGSHLTLEVNYSLIKKMKGVEEYLKLRTIPGATSRNWSSYSEKVELDKALDIPEVISLLPDPQTNGGLLIAVAEQDADKIENLFVENGLNEFTEPIGRFIKKKEKVIYIN